MASYKSKVVSAKYNTQLQACKYLSMQTDYAAGKVKPDFAETKLKLSLKSELCSNKHLQLCAIYGIWWRPPVIVGGRNETKKKKKKEKKKKKKKKKKERRRLGRGGVGWNGRVSVEFPPRRFSNHTQAAETAAFLDYF